jgi:hypothetical protein
LGDPRHQHLRLLLSRQLREAKEKVPLAQSNAARRRPPPRHSAPLNARSTACLDLRPLAKRHAHQNPGRRLLWTLPRLDHVGRLL